MTSHRVERILVLALTLGLVPPAWALVLGGGLGRKADCYVAWGGVTAANPRSVRVTCKDGDPCDQDGVQDGKCTFDVSICAGQTDPAGICTPQPLTAITPSPRNRNTTVSPPTPITLDLPALSGSACGAFTEIQANLRRNRRGKEVKSRPIVLHMVATSDARPRRDSDTLILQCLPGPSVGIKCSPNPDGGPDQVTVTAAARGRGTDLDNGWIGPAFNFLVVGSSKLDMCLTGCDGSTNPMCQAEGPTGPDSINGETYGAPLPLLAAGTPVCVVNRFRDPPGKVVGTANLETGEGTGVVRLTSEVYITSQDNRLCPQCSGTGIGDSGRCQAGPNLNQACVVDGSVEVVLPGGTTTFSLSSDCPPQGPPIARLTIDLDLTTGTTSNTSDPACPGQTQPNGCAGTPCNATCTGDACYAMVDDPTNPGGPKVCADKKGGISQLCCSNDSTRPCHPTAAEGGIVRTGGFTPLSPAWNQPGYPKSTNSVFASVFCEPRTGNPPIDVITTGLPGPGALLLSVTQSFTKLQ